MILSLICDWRPLPNLSASLSSFSLTVPLSWVVVHPWPRPPFLTSSWQLPGQSVQRLNLQRAGDAHSPNIHARFPTSLWRVVYLSEMNSELEVTSYSHEIRQRPSVRGDLLGRRPSRSGPLKRETCLYRTSAALIHLAAFGSRIVHKTFISVI